MLEDVESKKSKDIKTTPKDAESETSAFLCPDCGYQNPEDADFCMKWD